MKAAYLAKNIFGIRLKEAKATIKTIIEKRLIHQDCPTLCIIAAFANQNENIMCFYNYYQAHMTFFNEIFEDKVQELKKEILKLEGE